MLDFNKKVSLYVLMKRKEKGYKQSEMAEFLGVTKLTYLKKENAKTVFTFEEMVKIKEILSINIEDMLEKIK